MYMYMRGACYLLSYMIYITIIYYPFNKQT